MSSKNKIKKDAEPKTKTKKRKFRINKKLDGKTGIIFVGAEDPFLYFPDIMSYLGREEIENVKLRARGKSISNAVNVAEQFRNRFRKDFDTDINNVEIGTEDVPRKDKKGTFRMSFIEITLSNTNLKKED